MKPNLQEIKDQVAIKHGYKTFIEYYNSDSQILLIMIMDEVAEEYAKQYCIAQRVICERHCNSLTASVRENILNAPLATEQ